MSALRRRISRRSFLKAGLVAAVGAPWIVPSRVFGKPAPSGRIGLGVIGVGGMGKANLRAFLWRDDVQVVAVCDVDAAHREEAREIARKHDAEHRKGEARAGCDGHGDFREVLARSDVDAVVIATPDHWHVPIAIAAARAGKDMYCEKPLSLTIAQGRALSDEIASTGRVFQTGSQQRSNWKFRRACELVRNGRIGKLESIDVRLVGGADFGSAEPAPVPEGFDYDFWLGPAPWAPYAKDRTHWSFRYCSDYSGGTLTDWGAHHLDVAQWGHGSELSGPVEVEGEGTFPRSGLYDAAYAFDLTYRYADGVTIRCTHDGERGVKFNGSEGWIFVSRGRIASKPAGVLKSIVRPDEVRLYESDDHRGNFVECIRSRRPTAAPPEIAHRSVTLCHLGNIAMRLGRKVRWDPERERVVGDPEAQRMTARAMRAPWRL